MATPLLPLQLLYFLVAALAAPAPAPAPAPGRIPKVYNALITSNQNLEPSKAYPVYQPVVQDFGFPYQPVFFGEFPNENGLQPAPVASPKESIPDQPVASSASPPEPDDAKSSPTETPPTSPEPNNAPSEINKPTSAPPLPPNTQSPIPLNQFGLPSQVLPLGRIDPAYSGFNQIGPFRYSYPSLRFYDPFDPFHFNPYVNFSPLYRPLSNVLTPSIPGYSSLPAATIGLAKEAPNPPTSDASSQSAQTPPSEPSDLSVLNYASNDPAIPNVPPPPLPQGGLKPDNSE